MKFILHTYAYCFCNTLSSISFYNCFYSVRAVFFLFSQNSFFSFFSNINSLLRGSVFPQFVDNSPIFHFSTETVHRKMSINIKKWLDASNKCAQIIKRFLQFRMFKTPKIIKIEMEMCTKSSVVHENCREKMVHERKIATDA